MKCDLYRRWRHTRGFGVHSPLAYNLVKFALCPGRSYGWYGYEDIDLYLENITGRGLRNQRKKARLALRVATFCRSTSVTLFGKDEVSMIGGLNGGGFKIFYSSNTANSPSLSQSSTSINSSGTLNIYNEYFPTDLYDYSVNDNPLTRLSRGEDVLVFFSNKRYLGLLSEEIYKEMEIKNQGGVILEGRRQLIILPRIEMALHRYTVL